MKEVYVGWEIYFITGSDAVLEILTWKNVEGLLEECFFVAATRPGFQLGSVNHLPKGAMAKIKTIEVPALAISSTDIRHRVREGRPIKYLLPEAVEKFIFRKNYINNNFGKILTCYYCIRHFSFANNTDNHHLKAAMEKR